MIPAIFVWALDGFRTFGKPRLNGACWIGRLNVRNNFPAARTPVPKGPRALHRDTFAMMTLQFPFRTALGLTVLVLAGCSGGSGGSGGEPAPTTTYTVTASSGPGGSVTPGSLSVVQDAAATFTLSPETGYSIGGASGCGGTLNGDVYTTGAITAPCTVTASFVPAYYAVDVVVTAGGTINPSSETVAHGASVSFTVSAEPGYSIRSISGCNGRLEGDTYTTAPVTGPCTVSGSFVQGAQLPLYTIALSASPTDGGSVSGGGIYREGEQVVVSASAGPGHYFIDWTEGGVTVTTSAAYSFYVAGVRSLTANFEPMTYTVSASAGPGGSIEPAKRTVTYGATTSFSVSPASGYTIGKISGCNGTLSGGTYTTGKITADCAVEATFVTSPAPVLKFNEGKFDENTLG